MVFLIIEAQSKICSLVITKGGAKRIISPCVGFANKPFSANFKHTSHAETPSFSLIMMAFNNPFPLTKVILSDLMALNSVLNNSPNY